MNERAQRRGDFPNAFESAFARLQVRVEHACLGEPSFDWPAQIAAAIRAALAFAAADTSAAQILTNGALAEGKAGFARYDRMLDYFAAGLSPGRALRPHGQDLPEITEKAMVGGVAMLIAQRLGTGRAAELPTLAPEAILFALTPYLGVEEAKRIASVVDRPNPKSDRGSRRPGDWPGSQPDR